MVALIQKRRKCLPTIYLRLPKPIYNKNGKLLFYGKTSLKLNWNFFLWLLFCFFFVSFWLSLFGTPYYKNLHVGDNTQTLQLIGSITPVGPFS
jgi:hypothetical protein